MKDVNISTKETKEVVGNSKSQVDFDSTLKDEDSKEPMEKPFTLNKVRKKIKINMYEHSSNHG
jgi:hypothetical protein